MLAAPVEKLPEGPGWAYEPKFDGWRAIAVRRQRDVVLRSRAGRNLNGYFPDITAVVHAAVPRGVVLDGELVVWESGRTSFPLLQQRVTAGRGVARLARRYPAHYVVFDLLRGADGRDLLDVPLAQRGDLLAELVADAPASLALCPRTTDIAQARQWMTDWAPAGIEGVVAKRLDSRYQPGRRGWLKQRTRMTTEAVIGGVTGAINDPQVLLLGVVDPAGRLRYAGRTGPLSARDRRGLSTVLEPLAVRDDGGADHPWPQPLPARWSGQFQQPEPVPYVQVRPVLVAEIEVDTAFEYHRWRHPVRYLRLRWDRSVHDLAVLPGRRP